jgi:hypothetical protein
VLGALALAGHESEDPLTIPVPSLTTTHRRRS